MTTPNSAQEDTETWKPRVAAAKQKPSTHRPSPLWAGAGRHRSTSKVVGVGSKESIAGVWGAVGELRQGRQQEGTPPAPMACSRSHSQTRAWDTAVLEAEATWGHS